jgi:PmbA protein
MLDARRIPGKKTSIIFTNDLMSSILGVMFSRTVSAEAIQRGRSPWIGKVDHRVASDNFSLFDEGLRQGGLGTRAFDDEGVPQRTTRIIEKGILKSYLYDSYTASKDGVASTGNASRIASGLGSTGPYAQIPTPAPNNLILKPGDASIDELIEDTQKGLYVIECIGEWLSNPISGLLNATVTNAFEVRNGTISEPVKGVVVSGHFFDIMKNSISLIGDDVQNSGNVYAPSVRVSEMTVAGE